MSDKSKISPETDSHFIDKIQGMLSAFFVGDSLGAIFERRPVPEYTNIINQPAVSFSRSKGKVKTALGQVTDDSEMTLIILRRIVADKKYDKDKILTDYMEWGSIKGSKFMGKNTRDLFLNIKTLRGFNSRYKKFVSDIPEEKLTQSNGALMRCCPLFLLSGEAWKIDCSLTNPSLVTIDAERVYIYCLRFLFTASNGEDDEKNTKSLFKKLPLIAKTKEVKQIITDVIDAKNPNAKERDLSVGKGWVLHALYTALYSLKYFDNIMEMYDWVIGKNLISDTDTNAAISGALLGMKLGLKKMEASTSILIKESDPTETKENIFSHNLQVVLDSDSSTGDYKRDQKYSPKDYKKLSVEMWKILKKNCKIT